MKKLVVILDPAHGSDVAGKQSPDGTHKEYKWSRNIVAMLTEKLKAAEFEVVVSTTSDKEIGLDKRAQNANKVKGEHKFFISLHNNAAGNGTNWREARGFEVYTTPGLTTSDKYAEIVLKQLMQDFGSIEKVRPDLTDGDLDKEANFAVLRETKCPAILVEWLFQDNIQDVAYLKNPEINEKFCDSLVKALITIDSTL